MNKLDLVRVSQLQPRELRFDFKPFASEIESKLFLDGRMWMYPDSEDSEKLSGGRLIIDELKKQEGSLPEAVREALCSPRFCQDFGHQLNERLRDIDGTILVGDKNDPERSFRSLAELKNDCGYSQLSDKYDWLKNSGLTNPGRERFLKAALWKILRRSFIEASVRFHSINALGGE